MPIRCYVAWPHRMLHTYVFFLGGLRKDDWKNSMMVAKIAKQRPHYSFFLPFDREAILSPSTVLLYNLSIQNLVQNIFPNDFSRRVPCQLARHNANSTRDRRQFLLNSKQDKRKAMMPRRLQSTLLFSLF